MSMSIGTIMSLKSASAAASFTFHDLQTVYTSGSGATRTRTATVSTGDLVVVYVSNLSANTVTSVTGSDTVHSDTFTALTNNAGPSSVSGQFFYKLASNCSTGSGTYTVTATYSATPFGRGVKVWTFTPSSACSFDLEGGAASNAFNTALATGAIVTTGTAEVVFCGGAESVGTGTTTSWTIGGNSAATNASGLTNTGFYITGASLGSVSGAATWNAATAHCEQLCAFKI